ncbi:unnamed protein product [Clavelina lepadiformis]|uniref:Uncharacterized protein n=1 Tax=Clavelina lepadiformis TaxID=159417 RepID=A0ABP0FX23_CLALP
MHLADVAKENTAEQTRFGTDQADSKVTKVILFEALKLNRSKTIVLKFTSCEFFFPNGDHAQCSD